MYNQKQLQERIYRTEAELRILKEILNTSAENKTGRPIGSIEYSEEEQNFSMSCVKQGLTDPEIIAAYNKKFNLNLPKTSRKLYNFINRQGYNLNINLKQDGN